MNVHRGLFLGAAALAATAFTLGATPAALAKGSAGNKPPGNNGTVKIDEYTMDAGSDNDPHVSCGFSVNFYGYDGGAQQAAISIRPVAPTSGSSSYTTSTSWDVSSRTSGNQFDQSVHIAFSQLSAALSGVSPQSRQGYHLRLEVEVTGSQGSDDKYKTFWLEPCAGAASPSSQAPSPSSQAPSSANSASAGSAPSSSGPAAAGAIRPTTATAGGPATQAASTPAAGNRTAPGYTAPAGQSAPAGSAAPAKAASGSPEGSVSAAGASSAPALGAQVPAVVESGKTGGASLAFTGADIAGLGLAGLGLIGTGAALTWRSRRRAKAA